MALEPFLLEVLVCPETRGNLALAPADLLARLNAAIERGALHNRCGKRVTERLAQALVRQDSVVCYPVYADLPVLLVDDQIPLEQLA